MDGTFYWQNSGASWSDFERIKYLRTFLEAIRKELTELEGDPVLNKELITQEKVMVEATQKEIRRLERQSFCSQFGPN